MSEDVDTLMFGCGISLRNWTAEAVRGNKSPTHVNVYNADITKTTSGLDSDGMILVALMSGGDYIPAGIPGCGIKTACEAAKAGFGRDLCELSRNRTRGLREWRQRLEHELQTNENKLFRQRRKTVKVLEHFPDMKVLSYYTSPVVSSPERVSRLREEIVWSQGVNVPELRIFVSEAFEWQYLAGAKKFIRGLAPALLAHELIERSNLQSREDEALEMKQLAEGKLVKAICGRRAHWNTDGSPELRVAYIPAETVGLDLDSEEKGDFQGYMNDVSGDEQPASGGEEGRERSRCPTKRKGPSTYNPAEIEKIWVLETYVKLGVPLLVETWEEEMRNPKRFATRKAREKKALSKAGTKTGAMDRFVKITKIGQGKSPISEKSALGGEDIPIPPIFLAPADAHLLKSPSRKALTQNRELVGQKIKKKTMPKAKALEKTKDRGFSSQLSQSPITDINLNPWTLAKRPSEIFGFKSPTRYSALGIYPQDCQEDTERTDETQTEQQIQDSSPGSTTPKRRRSRPTTPVTDAEEKRTTPKRHERDNLSHNMSAEDPATPSRRDPSKVSPRKKCSPLQLANELSLASQLLIPTSHCTERQNEGHTLADTEMLISKKVNRRIDFTALKSPPAPPSLASSDLSSLPSPSTLLSPLVSKVVESGIDPPPPHPKIRPLPTKDAVKRLVAVRESLEGAWKHLEPWEAPASSANSTYSSVEVVDLTG